MWQFAVDWFNAQNPENLIGYATAAVPFALGVWRIASSAYRGYMRAQHQFVEWWKQPSRKQLLEERVNATAAAVASMQVTMTHVCAAFGIVPEVDKVVTKGN